MIKITCTSYDSDGKEIITRNYAVRTDVPHTIEFDKFIEDSIAYEQESRMVDHIDVKGKTNERLMTIDEVIDLEHDRMQEFEADMDDQDEWHEDPIQD